MEPARSRLVRLDADSFLPSNLSDAATRLPLEKFTAKVGGGFRQYPRPGGVLLPAALAPLELGLRVPARVPAGLADEERLDRGRFVVEAVARSMKALPAGFLAAPLPSPLAVVGACPIEQRTRNVLERLAPLCRQEGRGATWTVARYLRVPKLGARCLVDVLAAHEESRALTNVGDGTRAANDDGADAPPAEWLRELAGRVADQLPLTRADLDDLLARDGRGGAIPSLGALARAFHDVGLVAPFRVVRRGGAEIAISPGAVGVVAPVYENAARQVTAWGLTSVDDVVERVAALGASPVSRTVARRLLVALPRLRWLDVERTWFSLANERSAAGRAVARAFLSARALPVDALVASLAVRHAAFRRAPAEVVARYLADVAGCNVEGGLAHAPARKPTTLMTRRQSR
ncbi:MAG TPA: hypothetical protein VHJ20_14215 [Polyangia bacterium]|nr:hypothetical protein [Polyangia bacterium]